MCRSLHIISVVNVSQVLHVNFCQLSAKSKKTDTVKVYLVYLFFYRKCEDNVSITGQFRNKLYKSHTLMINESQTSEDSFAQAILFFLMIMVVFSDMARCK